MTQGTEEESISEAVAEEVVQASQTEMQTTEVTVSAHSLVVVHLLGIDPPLLNRTESV